MYFVYLILCADNSIYTGFTDNLERRFFEHTHTKGARHTKLNKAQEILYTEKFENKDLALKREKQIKGWSRKKKINLIKFGHPNPFSFALYKATAEQVKYPYFAAFNGEQVEPLYTY